jgi:hypothetical protein
MIPLYKEPTLARSWGEELGSYCLMGMEFQIGIMSKIWR